MARILVTGTLAIDYAATYPRTFAGLPRHDGINLSIHLSQIRRDFGGCAMNIAYSLALLGQQPSPFAFVGRDYEPDFARHLRALGMDTSGITMLEEAHSSHAFVITDANQNQFTGFYPGPAWSPDFLQRLREFAGRGFDYAVLAPDVPQNMVDAARVMVEFGIPFLCDPGQGLTDFQPSDSKRLTELSSSVILNEYEHRTLQAHVGDALARLDCLIVTLGSAGALWFERGHEAGRVPVVAVDDVTDPTGCGDAFRGGFVDARMRGAKMQGAMRAGALTAAISLTAPGPQRHSFDNYAARYADVWGERPEWLAQ